MSNLEQTPEAFTPQPLLHPVPHHRALPGLDEDPGWPQLLETWMNEFRPDSCSFEEHVRHTAEADLMLRREQTRFDAAYAKWLGDNPDPAEWDAKLDRKYRAMKSRLDGAQRTYQQWFKLIDSTRRARMIDKARLERSGKANAKGQPEKRRGVFTPSDQDNTLGFIQVISTRIINGELKTSICPPNHDVMGAVRRADHPRITVRRRFAVPEELPAEYDWMRREDGTFPRYLEWLMSKDDYLVDAQREEEAGTGHILPSEHIPLDTPKAIPENSITKKPVREIVLRREPVLK